MNVLGAQLPQRKQQQKQYEFFHFLKINRILILILGKVSKKEDSELTAFGKLASFCSGFFRIKF
jgi:hypothetical protein